MIAERLRLISALAGNAPIGLTLERARYAAAQGARVAWYAGHYALARRLSAPFDRPGEPPFRSARPAGSAQRIRDAFLALFVKDRANIEAGLYPPPADMRPLQAFSALSHSAKFFADLPKVDARRVERRGDEVRASNALLGRYPDYYLQNFHYQSDGWLSEDSAELYDTQVEVLFGGAADAMRRLALGALLRGLKGRDQRKTTVIDFGCGNGRFLAQALEARPRLLACGLDLSPAYAAAARRRLSRWGQADVIVGAAEHAPFADGAADGVCAIYLFHELPPKVRREAAREIARVLKRGGVFVLADSLQWGDEPALEQMLDYFPQGFHEPYYASYLDEDLTALFGAEGLVLEAQEQGFLTKIMRFRKA